MSLVAIKLTSVSSGQCMLVPEVRAVSAAHTQHVRHTRESLMESKRRPGASQPAAGMLVFGYLSALVAIGWSLMPDYGRGDPTVLNVLAAQLRQPLLWAALLLTWGADVALSLKGDLAPGGKGLTVGRMRFFHGPLVTGVIAGAVVLGLLVTLRG